jgi:hypothetical protein
MKKIFLIIFIISFCSVYSQTKEKELSNAEKFSAKSGVLIKKEYVEINVLKSASFKVVIYSDLMNNTKASALRIEYETANKYSTDTKIAVLDADEIVGFIASIKLIREKIFTSSPVIYTEVTFKSRSGFEAGCYWSKDKWNTYLKLEKYDKDSYIFLDKDDFEPLLTILEQAKVTM